MLCFTHLLPEVIPELARGVSTALAVWATPGCPACPSLSCSPSLSCPESTSCPACICQGSERSCPVSVDTPRALLFVLGFLCGIVFTIASGSGASFVKGYLLAVFPRCTRRSTPVRISAAQIALARRQPALETF